MHKSTRQLSACYSNNQLLAHALIAGSSPRLWATFHMPHQVPRSGPAYHAVKIRAQHGPPKPCGWHAASQDGWSPRPLAVHEAGNAGHKQFFLQQARTCRMPFSAQNAQNLQQVTAVSSSTCL